jgi:PAS domain S-box-containing protein
MERRGEVELVGAPSLDWVGVPLKLGDKTIGVLAAQTYTEGVRYGERERDILQFVSTQVAQAIERKHAEDQLKESEAKYRVLFESNPEAMWVYDDTTQRFLAVNDAAVDRYRWSRDEFLRMSIGDIRPEAEQGKVEAPLARRGLRHRRKDGSLIDVEVLAHPVTFAGRSARLVLAKDVTERLRLEQQLRQAQKMEAVGRLAGGVAHDFNNILTAILGSAELLIQDLPEGHEHRIDAEEIRRAAQRAADLTRQLLAFSRQQVLAPKVLDVNAVVQGVERMLRRLIGENIELRTTLARDLGAVRADPSQLEQVILNLAVNARDAMPQGGKLTIETAHADLDEDYAPATAGTGRHVLLAVSDTGTGMDEATRAHLFEPFYTTKEIGRGTGLGLATVYGVVKQSGGHIWVYSEPGHGSTFKIYLPTVAESPEPVVTAEQLAVREAAGGTETILLVEDEQIVRSLARRVLIQQGYTVLDAPAGPEALALSDAHTGEIHLLLTDVVMPGIGGRELARRFAARRPDAGVLYLSGYSDDAILRHGLLDPGTFFLQKPFTPQALTHKVREVLDAGR